MHKTTCLKSIRHNPKNNYTGTDSYMQLVDMVSMELLNDHATTQIAMQDHIRFVKVLQQMPHFRS